MSRKAVITTATATTIRTKRLILWASLKVGVLKQRRAMVAAVRVRRTRIRPMI
jgi:hypothetical protein